MAIFRWRGDGAGTKTAWNDGRNWVDETGAAYAEARYPGSDATPVYDDVVLDVPITGTMEALAGYNGASLVELASFVVSPAYDAGIASDGAKLIIPFTDAVINGTAAGDIYLQPDTGSGSLVVQDLKSDSTLYLSGALKSLFVIHGACTCTTTWATDEIVVVGGVTGGTAASLTITSAGDIPAIPVQVLGGTFTDQKGCSVDAAGGVTNIHAGSAAVTQSSGTVNWYAGTITDARIYGGTFTAAGLVAFATITKLRIGGTATVNMGTSLATYTLEAYVGGTLIPAVSGG